MSSNCATSFWSEEKIGPEQNPPELKMADLRLVERINDNFDVLDEWFLNDDFLK